MAKEKSEEKTDNRVYETKGISAKPEWWDQVESEAEEMGIGRSGFIRLSVNAFLKKSNAGSSDRNELATAI